MVYSIYNNKISLITENEIKSEKLTLASYTFNELKEKKDIYNIDSRVIENFEKHLTYYMTSLHEYNEYTYGVINKLEVKNLKTKIQIGFLLKDNLFLLIQLSDEKVNYVENVMQSALQKVKGKITLEKIIYELLDRLLRNANDVLGKIDNEVIKMEELIITDDIDMDLNKQIFKYRNRLSVMKNYYEQLIDAVQDLKEIDMFEDYDCMYLDIFINKCERICSKIQELSEEFIHVREALDAALDYKLNKNMNIFTVVTTIFLPLTLITGWYGMNFKYMPEINSKFGYIGVIIISLMIAIGCIIFFKKKKLL